MVHHNRRRADFGVVGLGRFGRLLAGHLASRGSVLGWDLSLQGPAESRDLPSGVAVASLPEACGARVVVFAVPIGALESALLAARPHLRPPVLVADTCSVKVWPCRWLLAHLPAEAEAVGTHPLFGPDSAAASLAGHKVAVVPLRTRHPRSVRRFLESFGLEAHFTTPAEHDEAMAETQSLVHWIGRALEQTGARPRAMDTQGYRRLLEILGYVTRDSWELYRDLQHWNPYAPRSRRRLLQALTELDRQAAGPDDPAPAP